MTFLEPWPRARFALGILLCVLAFGVSAWLGRAAKGDPLTGLTRSRSSSPIRAHERRLAPSLPPLERPGPPVAAVTIPEGEYTPFFKDAAEPKKIRVRPFQLDQFPVSRAAYRAFVLEHSEWQKSRVKALFAEATYLADWPSDVDAGGAAGDAPVTFVSWFAAKAYCASLGKRLPSLVEWESFAQTELGGRVLGLSRVEAGVSTPVLPAISEWISDFNSSLVSGGKAGEDASNLFCGAGARATDASDYQAFLRYSFRSSLKASFALKRLGFRCAKDGS